MSDIKVDDTEYYAFLNSVETFLKDLDPEKITVNQKNQMEMIEEYINNQFELRRDRLERKAYYEFYINNRYSKPEEANKAYRQYKEVNHKLKNRNCKTKPEMEESSGMKL